MLPMPLVTSYGVIELWPSDLKLHKKYFEYNHCHGHYIDKNLAKRSWQFIGMHAMEDINFTLSDRFILAVFFQKAPIAYQKIRIKPVTHK